jgi:methyl-accepting chemotaxis protein
MAQSVVGMVDEAAEISERTNTEAQTAAASAQEQTATVADVADDVRDLSDRTDELMELLGGFDIAGTDPKQREGQTPIVAGDRPR